MLPGRVYTQPPSFQAGERDVRFALRRIAGRPEARGLFGDYSDEALAAVLFLLPGGLPRRLG
jgi:hypothetical protein